MADVKADARIAIQPLTEVIFQRSVTPEGLRVPELHDRFIISTGLYLQDLGHTVFILTKDQTIASTGVLTVIW